METPKKIATYARTREIIEKYNFFIKKKFGQNFLVDNHVINKIIKAADIQKTDLVIEIGPGIGGLTEELAERAGHVIAVEIDETLIPVLADTLAPYDNVEILNKDILELDLLHLIESSPYKNVKVVANLPYYITTAIIMDFLEKKYPIESMIVMVQKEVAERMKAKPATKEYGSLTIAMSYYANVSLVANVPPNCFIPRPNVASQVIHIKIKEKQDIVVQDENLLFEIIRTAFAQRRKTLSNCLFNLSGFGLEKTELIELISSCGFDERVRGEALNLKEFALISDAIGAVKNK